MNPVSPDHFRLIVEWGGVTEAMEHPPAVRCETRVTIIGVDVPPVPDLVGEALVNHVVRLRDLNTAVHGDGVRRVSRPGAVGPGHPIKRGVHRGRPTVPVEKVAATDA